MLKPVQESLKIVQEAKAAVKQQLTGTEHVHQLLELDSLFRRIETRLNFMGAVTEPEAGKPVVDQFPPITNFMGEKIVVDKKVVAADINPSEAEKKAYLAKVEKLYAEIGTMPVDIIRNAYSIPDDVKVLRGVAKRAGVKDFDKRDVNEEFIKEIKAGIADKAAVNKKQAEIDAQLKEIKSEVVLTQEMINADADLIKWKAEPGDILITRQDGKRRIQKAKGAAGQKG